MINIALCANNIVCRRIMTNMLDRIRPYRDFNITEPPSDSRFLTNIKKSSPDIILVDENFITSRTRCGHESARLLSENCTDSELILLTSNPDYISRHPDNIPFAGWILKPADYEEVKNTVLSSITRISPFDELRFRCGRKSIVLNPDDILYFEADKRCTNIRTKEKSYVSSENISTIEERLPENLFFRSHRTYILNTRHIASTENDIIKMTNGEYVLLSRLRKSEFLKQINQ